jgi:hypothetical protein
MADQPKKENTPVIDSTPRWFLLSYDAGKEVEDWELNEKYEKIKSKSKKREYETNDFRYKLIKVLRQDATRRVGRMEQFVETTIAFQDPNSTTSVSDKTRYWENLFRGFGKQFFFILTPLYHMGTTSDAFYKDNRVISLAANFQKLLAFVQKEEEDQTLKQ